MNTNEYKTANNLANHSFTQPANTGSNTVTISQTKWLLVTTDDTSGLSTLFVGPRGAYIDNLPTQTFAIQIPPTGNLFLPANIHTFAIANNDTAKHTYTIAWGT